MTTGLGNMNERINEIATIDNGIFGFLSEGKHRIILTPSIRETRFRPHKIERPGFASPSGLNFRFVTD